MSSSAPKGKTFAFTLRPRNGITNSDIVKMEKFVRSKCEYYHVITEKLDDERHIHAALILKSAMTRSDVSTYLKRMFKHLEPDEQKVMLQGLKVMYNSDFINNYLNKDDNTVVVASNLPEVGCLESYFTPKPPPKDVSLSRRLAFHSLMDELEKLWFEHVPPHLEKNTINARNFLFDMQYSKRLIGLMDDKRMVQTSRWLVRWMNKSERCSFELPPFEKEEGPGFH